MPPTHSCAESQHYIEGIGLWAPRLPGWESARAILRGEAAAPQAPAARPAATLLPPNERRRAPDTVVLALEVAQQACAQARRDPRTLPCVFASTHGDLALSDYLCATLARSPALTSPTRFHNSVHNAAAGYWTVATGCTQPYTALSAFGHTFGQGLLESAVRATCDCCDVLYVAYDIEARGPFTTMAPSRGWVGGALVLGREASRSSLARVRWRVRAAAEPVSTPPRPANAALVEGNAMADCLTLFEALADGGPRELVQTLGPQLVLELHVEPCG